MKTRKWFMLAGIVLIILFTGACRFGNVSFTILQTSDLHHHASGSGAFLDYTPMNTEDNDPILGGFARLATLIKDIRQEREATCAPVLLFDSGDFFMGTVYDLTVANPLVLQYLTEMGYDAVTLGNHEFDWGSAGLAMLLQNGLDNGFNVPIVASNMVVPEGNVLQNFIAGGVIVNKKIIELPYGGKIGVLGIMGLEADSLAPAAPPVTFNHDYEFLQQQVDQLRKNDKVNLVVLLSHGGVENDGTGDDADIAQNVKGIDIIASGHYHTATHVPIVVGESGTLIFSPGRYGEYLSRLDVTVNIFTRKIVNYSFELILVDDSIPGDEAMQALVEDSHDAINQNLVPLGVTIDAAISGIDFTLERGSFRETGIGNLVADSLRATANALAPINKDIPFDFSVVASGVIRSGLYPGSTKILTFADIYRVLPLGISPFQPVPPGYPLMSLWVTGADLRNIVEAGLTVAPALGSSFYLNFSGLEIYYNPAYAPYYAGVRALGLYDPSDVACIGPTIPVNVLSDDPADGLYRCVVDFYALQMMEAVTAMGLQIIPRDEFGTEIPPAEYILNRIDIDPTDAHQELKEWMALVNFLGEAFPYYNPITFEPDPSLWIPEALYGEGGSALGRINEVNF
ncbi:MAG TPA: bifunctional metallophosphatase/5'-nucleotidase [Deltaproteobacteria bacterium]|nr:bifunctional metallophosphatase/5'-nucleotidase [Deltaproteobacteria bacterium]